MPLGGGAWRVNWNMISVAPTKSQKSFLAYAKSEIEFFTLDKALQAQERDGDGGGGVYVCVEASAREAGADLPYEAWQVVQV